MKTPLRLKFMKWLTIQTFLVFGILAAILYLFNLHEQTEFEHNAREEAEEFLIMIGLMAATTPFILGSAWSISRQLLKPIQTIVRSAEMIRDGNLDHRVETGVATDELGKLARTINEAFDRYQQSLKRLDRFSYDAAHQLRNPLAAIRAAGEVCLQKERSPEQYRETVGQILEDVDRLSHTVSQLLTLARLDRGHLASAFEEVDLTMLVRTVLDEIAPVGEAKSIRVTASLPDTALPMKGVPNLLREAVVNLVDNALRFTPEYGRIEVRLRKESSHMTLLTVADSGPGLPTSMREHIFDRTRGAESSPRDGAGLGLAIAADVIRVHGGTVHAANGELGGAEFTVQLPCD